MKSKHLYAFVILIFVSNWAFAFEKVTKEDLKSLPPLCKGTQLIRGVSGDKTPMDVYTKQYGQEFIYLHHYCFALKVENDFYKNPSSAYWQGKLNYAIGDLDFVLERSSPTFVLLPDILLAKARIYALQKQNGLAVITAHKAVEAKPDYVRAYTFISDLYEKLGDKTNAIKTLQSALERVPDSTPIMNRLTRLGVTPPKREPVEAIAEEAPPQPSPSSEATVSDSPGATPAQPSPEPRSPQTDASQEQPPKPTTQQNGDQPPNNPYCRFCP